MTHPMLDLAAWDAAVTDQAVMVADGHNVKVTVRDKELEVTDGVPGNIRVRRIALVPRIVNRLVILGGNGMVTLEALRWCEGAGIGITHLDYDGAVTITSGSQEGDARIIRNQVNGSIEVARYLIAAKLRAQANVLAQFFDYNAGEINDTASDIEAGAVKTTETLRGLEGDAAATYWELWRNHGVGAHWSPADLVKVHAHWRSFPGRSSLRRSYETNRGATDPVNAILNFAYHVLESETLHVCRMFNLHPDLGVMHADGTDRHPFVLDLMEPVRPFVDALVLQYLTGSGYFDRRNVHEIRDGKVRCNAPLTTMIAGWAADIQQALIPYAAKVADMLSSQPPVQACRGDRSNPRPGRTRSRQAA
jgi:CRISPR-associated endonuclease Cas1